MTSRVYLDHAATTPLRPEVLEAMLPWLGLATTAGFGNAAALNQEGRQARQALEAARAEVAQCIGATPPEIVFTSGGTESNNALIGGIAAALSAQAGFKNTGGLLITSAFEHHAVLEPAQALQRQGWRVLLLKPDHQGLITEPSLRAALEPRETAVHCAGSGGSAGQSPAPTGSPGRPSLPSAPPVLVSIMAAQNEIGTLQPLPELAAATHQAGALLHTDAVQALGKVAFNVQENAVDAASFSAHKLGGPKGVGAFYLRLLTPFQPQQLGGGQEGGRRSGTANVAGAVGLARALSLAVAEQESEAQRLTALRNELATSLLAADRRIQLSVDPRQIPALPQILSILIAGAESADLVLKLDQAGFAVAGGAACSAAAAAGPSHVLLALGYSPRQAESVLRISLGAENTAADLARFSQALLQILADLDN